MASHNDISDRGVIGCFLVGAMLGAIIVGALISLNLVPVQKVQILEHSMQYADLLTIMLACVALLVTVLGVGVAIIAIWGIGHMRDQAKSAAVAYVKEELKDGELRKIVESRIDSLTMRHAETRIQPGKAREIDPKWGVPGTEYGDE